MKKLVYVIAGLLVALVITIMVMTGLQIFTYAQTYILCELIDNGNTEQALCMISFMPTVNSYNVPPIFKTPYSIFTGGDYYIITPLTQACDEGDSEVITALLERGADPDKYLEGTWSPLEVTAVRCRENRPEIYAELLKHGADPDGYASYCTALVEEIGEIRYLRSSYAKDLDEQELKKRWSIASDSIMLLLDNGASPKDNYNNSIYHYLCRLGEAEWIKECVDTYGYSLNEANDSNETPLHWAVHGESVDTVQYLLSQGVDTQVKDNKGKTAYDYAVESGNEEIIRLLEEAEQQPVSE